MSVSLFLERGESTYNTNVGVVQESTTVTTTSEQYWAQRQTQAEIRIARFQTSTSMSTAEQNWKNFSAKGATFLKRLLWRACDRLEKPLRNHWNGDKLLARDATRLFKSDVIVELLIPFSRQPLRFVTMRSHSSSFEIRSLESGDELHLYEIGRPYIAVSWKNVCLFAITPSGQYVTMETFFLDTPDGARWSTDLVLPGVFAAVAKEFTPELDLVASQFAPLLEYWCAKEHLEQEVHSLRRMNKSADAWNLVQIPEGQKLEILKALELFENADSAAPHGLLLTGPSGVGKSYLGKTIAETAGCNFQHLTPATLKLDHLGGSGRRVHEIWEEARRNQPSILYLDECEGVLGRRGAAETDALSTEIVQAFLAECDGLDKSTRVWLIGATNRRDLLDDAILSRFGWEMQIKLPSENERISILQQELKSVAIEVSLPGEFGALTQGMSGRDLQEAAKTARRMAHPDKPTLEQIREAIKKLRKGHNTQVSVHSKWESLVLDHKILGRLKLISGLLRDAEKWASQGVSIPHALLLEGPPGTGKTEIARTLANESGLAFHAATTADLKANYLGQSGNRVKQLFERARSHSPCILFLDELDIVAPDSGLNGDDPLTREIVGQLLQEIDGVEAHAEHIFLVGATNRPNAIDRAVLSRLSERLVISVPDHRARVRLLSNFLIGKKLAFPLEDGAILLADLTEGKGLSGRDLRNWVGTAEQNALLRAMDDGGPEHYTITLDDFSSS
jgi:SpoVK/Ycf46/Vps4 family AAA+-type ATPase